MRKTFLGMAVLWLASPILYSVRAQTPAPKSGDAKPGAAAASPAKAAQAPPAKAPRTAAPNPGGAAPGPAGAAGTLKTQKEKASYAIGLNIGKGLHKDSVEIDPNLFLQGLKDGLSGGKTLMSDDDAKAAMLALQNDLRKGQEQKMQQAGEVNKKEGDAFLAANKSKPGVVTLSSGLQYKILKQGTGPKPTAADTVVCNYRGTLLDNTEFDSSYKSGQPASFPVGQVIHGWTEALQLMPVGSKWQLFIPADLAYGARGAGPMIGPGATLIFEVELLSIQGK